jgi:hypothetical protein
MKRNLLTCVWIGLFLSAAGIMTAQADTVITFSVNEASNVVNGSFVPGVNNVYARGTFNGWGAYIPLAQVGSTTVYTNTVDDTVDANGGNLSYIYHDDNNGDEGPADWANRAAYLPTNSGASLVLGTPYFDDIGPATSANVKFQVDMSEEIELGHFHPGGGDTVIVAGSFNGWSITPGAQFTLTNDPTILVTNYNFPAYPGGLVESNVYTVTAAITLDARTGTAAPNCAENFKYVEMPEGSWDSPSYPNIDSGGNRFFTEGNQTLPLVNFSDVPYTPLCQATLNVDMSGVIAYDTNHVSNSETVWGTFNNWTSGVTLTNNPTGPNSNIYSGVISIGEGAQYIYQFRYTNSAVAASSQYPWVYDFIQDQVLNNNDRRTIEVPAGVYSTNLPTVFFNDLKPNDYLQNDTPVSFSVNMNGVVTTNGSAFNPSSDGVYINGEFASYGGYPQSWYPWAGGANPVAAPPGYQLMQVGSTEIYTNTVIIPKGTPVALSYQYGTDPGGHNSGPVEDESPSGENHFRVVRSTALNPYTMPVDTFTTNQPYVEPFFSTGNIMGIGNLAGGNLTVGAPVAGKVPVSWLGRPGAHLQSATSLTGLWTDYPNTDGTNWTAGSSTTNGFMSNTNWPSNGNTFFRLVKP